QDVIRDLEGDTKPTREAPHRSPCARVAASEDCAQRGSKLEERAGLFEHDGEPASGRDYDEGDGQLANLTATRGKKRPADRAARRITQRCDQLGGEMGQCGARLGRYRNSMDAVDGR